MLSNLSKEIVADVELRDRDSVGVFKRHLFPLVKQGACFVVWNVQDFFGGHTQLAAHGSVDVLSEDAPIQGGHASIDQGRQLALQQSRGRQAVPHADDRMHHRRSAGIDQIGFQRGAPPLQLSCEDLLFSRLRAGRIDTTDSCHGILRKPRLIDWLIEWLVD